MMIPRQEFERLQEYYKGKITQSALLNKAGRLAAEKHMILKNPKIPSGMAVKMIKPLAREQARLTKRIRLGAPPTVGVGVPDEDEAMVDSPLETLLKQIIKKEPAAAAVPVATPGPSGVRIKKESPSTSGIKKGSLPKTPIPSTSGKKSAVSQESSVLEVPSRVRGRDPLQSQRRQRQAPQGQKDRTRETRRRLARLGRKEETHLWQGQGQNQERLAIGLRGRNVNAAMVSTSKSGWARPASSFIGRATSTWDRARI